MFFLLPLRREEHQLLILKKKRGKLRKPVDRKQKKNGSNRRNWRDITPRRRARQRLRKRRERRLLLQKPLARSARKMLRRVSPHRRCMLFHRFAGCSHGSLEISATRVRPVALTARSRQPLLSIPGHLLKLLVRAILVTCYSNPDWHYKVRPQTKLVFGMIAVDSSALRLLSWASTRGSYVCIKSMVSLSRFLLRKCLLRTCNTLKS